MIYLLGAGSTILGIITVGGDKSKQKSLGHLELSTRALIISIDIDTVDDQIVRMQMRTNLVDTTKKVNTAIQAKELLEHRKMNIKATHINPAITPKQAPGQLVPQWSGCSVHLWDYKVSMYHCSIDIKPDLLCREECLPKPPTLVRKLATCTPPLSSSPLPDKKGEGPQSFLAEEAQTWRRL